MCWNKNNFVLTHDNGRLTCSITFFAKSDQKFCLKFIFGVRPPPPLFPVNVIYIPKNQGYTRDTSLYQKQATTTRPKPQKHKPKLDKYHLSTRKRTTQKHTVNDSKSWEKYSNYDTT